MKRAALLTCFTVVGLSLTGTSPAAAGDSVDRGFVAGELVVRFEPGARPTDRAAALAEVRAGKSVSLHLPGMRLVAVEGRSVPRAVEVLERQPGVLYAEPNFIDRFRLIPNDVYFGSQWALDNTGLGIGNPPVFGTPGVDIDAVKGWNRGIGSSDVVVGIADTGIFSNHPDLGPNMYVNPGESGGGKESNGVDDDGNGYTDDFRGYDFFAGDNDPSPANPPIGFDRHGTQVASVAGARGNDSVGMTGVSQQTSLLPLRIGDNSAGAPASEQIEAYTYAGRLNAEIVNLSAGGPGFSQARLDAIRAAPDTLFVFAAGNDGTNNDDALTPAFPCNHNEPNVVCVAATDQDDQLRATSNYGPQSVDLGAPGSNILTADIGTDPANSFRFSSGTSLASPVVAGAAAVYRSLYPQATAADTRDALLAGVDALPSLAGLVESGGRLNLDRTLAITPPDTLPPPQDNSIRLLLKARGVQRVKKLKVKVGCGDEPCKAILGGNILAMRKRGHNSGATADAARKRRSRRGKRTFAVRVKTFSLAAGEKRILRVKLKRSRKSIRLLRRLLKDGRYRRASRAKLKLRATDAVGNKAVRRVAVRLKR